MKIALIEPFYSGSHQQWADALQKFSKHQIQIFSLPGRHWKWRMHGGAVTLAQMYLESDFEADLILATDMLDLSTFLSLTRSQTAHLPTAIYFHENQLTYPWSPNDQDVAFKRDNHYSFINYTSALSADKIFFNSAYHQESFLNALPEFLGQFPDKKELATVDLIAQKSQVLYLGLDLQYFDAFEDAAQEKERFGTIVWNHRWEYDKNPVAFFDALFTLQDRGMKFHLIVMGEQTTKHPPIFAAAKERLSEHILHWGYAASKEEYAQLLWKSDILAVTSIQDFFGGSVVEAMYCNCIPLLPNRLAYPEHSPKAYHTTFYYQEEKELVKRLQGQLFHIALLRKQNTQQFVEKYDWESMIKEYDKEFENLKIS